MEYNACVTPNVCSLNEQLWPFVQFVMIQFSHVSISDNNYNYKHVWAHNDGVVKQEQLWRTLNETWRQEEAVGGVNVLERFFFNISSLFIWIWPPWPVPWPLTFSSAKYDSLSLWHIKTTTTIHRKTFSPVCAEGPKCNQIPHSLHVLSCRL